MSGTKMLMNAGVAFFMLVTLASARQVEIGMGTSELSLEHERQLLDEEEEATAFAELLGEALSIEPPQMSEEFLEPIIESQCTTDSAPFYQTLDSTYLGCFAICQFVDFCEMFTYNPEEAECRLYHNAEAQWNVEDSPYYCWGILQPINDVTVTV